jgi:hypothetical protein
MSAQPPIPAKTTDIQIVGEVPGSTLMHRSKPHAFFAPKAKIRKRAGRGAITNVPDSYFVADNRGLSAAPIRLFP